MIFKRQLLFTKQVSIFSIIVIAKKMRRELIYFMHPFFINDSTLIPPKAMGTFAMITQICFLDFIEQIQLRCTKKNLSKGLPSTYDKGIRSQSNLLELFGLLILSKLE